MEQVLEFLKPMLDMYQANLPSWLVGVFTIVGSLRIFLKPLMGLMEAYVSFSPSKADDKMPEKIKNNKIYKSVVYVIDWFSSIKFKK